MKFLEIFKEVSPYSYIMILWKLRKSDMLSLNDNESFSLKSPYDCIYMDNKTPHFSFSVKFIYNKLHEATLKLDLAQRNMLIAHTDLLLQIIGG